MRNGNASADRCDVDNAAVAAAGEMRQAGADEIERAP
jgi:hypothetical protein